MTELVQGIRSDTLFRKIPGALQEPILQYIVLKLIIPVRHLFHLAVAECDLRLLQVDGQGGKTPEGKGYPHAEQPFPDNIGHFHAQILRRDLTFAGVDQQVNMSLIVAGLTCLNPFLYFVADTVYGKFCHICALKGDDAAQILVCFLPSQQLQLAAHIQTVCLSAADGIYDQLFQRVPLVFPRIITSQKCQFDDFCKIGGYIELPPCHGCFHF